MNYKKTTGFFIFVFGTLIMLILYYFQEVKLHNRLDACSIFTIAKITKVYSKKGFIRIKYSFSINNISEEITTSVGPPDTGEWWEINTQKLSKRKLLVQVWCKDFKENRILWDISIPDTLQIIPPNGWDKIPYGLDKVE